MEEKALKILFLAKWYPNRFDSMLGLFVQRHAEAVSKYAHVNVISVVTVPKLNDVYEVQTKTIKNLSEIIIYTRKAKSFLSPLNTIINGWRYIAAHLAAWKILQSTDFIPDITHVHVLTRAGIIALFFKIRYKVPYVITEHWSRYMQHHDGYNGLFRKKLTEKIVRYSSGISTVSNVLKQAMIAANINHRNWQIIPNVVDVYSFKPDNNLKSEKFRFSHISCFEEQSKNMRGILDAVKILKDKNLDFELVMIGDGQDWEDTVRYSKELGLDDVVSFTGVLEGDKLISMMNTCHCSIIFSFYETFSIVIPENLACGIPVIATSVGGIPEVLPVDFGKLIPSNDIKALAEAMKAMMTEETTYDKEAMIQYVEDHFSYSEVGFRFVRMYREALLKS